MVIPSSTGADLGLLAIVDITARKRAEGAVRRSADELLGIPLHVRQRPVQERVMQQYEITTEDGRELPRDEMVAVRAAVHGETIRGTVLRVKSRTGPARWLRLNAIPYLVDGRHVGAVLSMTDVTDRKQAEQALRELNEKLREADRRKDEFLGMLSHELRNPLAPIRNALYILDRAEPDSPQARRAREVATRQIRHLGAETLAELVRMLGHDVETAFDGPTALDRARARPPDVVLCDIGLPGMDGYEVARALRAAHDGRMRLVAVSGYAQPEDLERAAEAGFDEHIAKPPDPAQIEGVLAAVGAAHG